MLSWLLILGVCIICFDNQTFLIDEKEWFMLKTDRLVINHRAVGFLFGILVEQSLSIKS